MASNFWKFYMLSIVYLSVSYTYSSILMINLKSFKSFQVSLEFMHCVLPKLYKSYVSASECYQIASVFQECTSID